MAAARIWVSAKGGFASSALLCGLPGNALLVEGTEHLARQRPRDGAPMGFPGRSSPGHQADLV